VAVAGGRSVVLLTAISALGVAGTLMCTTSAWAGGPGGVVENTDLSRAVGSGLVNGVLVGYTATGPTNEAAGAAVVSVCAAAGAEQCSSDEVTNDVFCVVTVGADDGSGIVAGGAGATVEAARVDAFANAGRAGVTLDPAARVLASSCP
jgi:hypothetical protein